MSRDIVLALDVEAEPKVVFDTVATRAGLATFWTPDVDGEGSEGGELTFGFEAAPTRLPMRVTRSQSPTQIEWACDGDWPFWGGSRVSWSFEPAEAGTRMILRHLDYGAGMPDYEFGRTAFTWSMVVGKLKSVTESGGAPDPALR